MTRAQAFSWFARAVFALSFFVPLHEAVQAKETFRLSLPVDCKLGQDCFVQNYVDLDPEPGVLDAACGAAAYDGHKGTDFRVLNTKATANVLAAAAGIVRGVRNDMADRLVQTEKDRADIVGRECGNGVVLVHEDGWETQYCHLQKGSVAVQPGDKVARGQKLGRIGYSGLAAFAHVHLSVRKDGAVFDPFLGRSPSAEFQDACAAAGPVQETSLWQAEAGDLLKDAAGSLIELGFASGPVSTGELERGTVSQPSASADALVFFARAINLRKGDRLVLKVEGPDGEFAASSGKPMEKTKAQWVAFSGRKLREKRWQAGTYQGEAVLVRNGKAASRETARFVLD
ncbi:M23 family metallopeptidase [Roseibium sp.]|uniref:M23 family metallopeptidase n=1 Tax=Roseibium sp. TaxID=1936156 RepID=UPI003B51F322